VFPQYCAAEPLQVIYPSVWWATIHRRGIKVWLSHKNELTHILRLGDGSSVQERRTPPVGGHEIPSFTHRYAQPVQARR